VLNDNAVKRHFSQIVIQARFWELPETCHGASAAGRENRLPRYPWPPPRFSAHNILPRSFLGSEHATLAAIYHRLAAALEASGFEENGVFEVPGGFALATQLERIRADGSSDSRERWTDSKAFPLDLADYLGRLFLRRPGQFRLIAFLVTTENNLANSHTLPSEGWARSLSLAGARMLTPQIGSLDFSGRSCHVLIYHFQRRHGGAVVLDPSPLSTREHLRRAGIWAKLAV